MEQKKEGILQYLLFYLFKIRLSKIFHIANFIIKPIPAAMRIIGNITATPKAAGIIKTGIRRTKINPKTAPRAILIGRVIRKNPALITQMINLNATIPSSMSKIPARISIASPFFRYYEKKMALFRNS